MLKQMFFLFMFFIIGIESFSQVLRDLPEEKQSEMDIVFRSLDESGIKKITKDQVLQMLDSLEQIALSELKKENNKFKINEEGDTIYSIGDKAHGGIVFWVDETETHGLVAAPIDQTGGVTWYPGKTRALKDGVYTGKYNTEQIISNKSVAYNAAIICKEYNGGGFDDWYLPSLFELNLLYKNRRIIGGFYRDYYWSSSSDIGDIAWIKYFYNGLDCKYHTYGTRIYRVRAIRIF